MSAFRTLDKVINGTYTSGADILSSDLDFSKNTANNNNLGTPPDVMRETQVQFIASTPGVLSVTFDGSTFFPVNDNNSIEGVSTFTIFVDNFTLLNFRFDANASIIITVGG